MSGYSSDRQWSDQFIPRIKRIVGPLLLEPAPIEEDNNHATDLIILNARDRRIACRMRRHGFAEKFPNDFTIRSQRDSGHETELSKIVNGLGDWFFYGHATVDSFISRWMVVDLSAWRSHRIRNPHRCKPAMFSNNDGTHFAVFNLRQFVGKPDILVAAGCDAESEAA